MATTRSSGGHRPLAESTPAVPAAPPLVLPAQLPPSATVGLSPKATWTTAAAGLLGLAVAALNGLQGNPALIAFLPPWAQWGVLTLAPALLVALAGYWAPAGDIYVPGDPGPIASVRTPEERPAVPPSAADDTMAAWLARSGPATRITVLPESATRGRPYSDPYNDLEDAAYDELADDDDPYWDRPDAIDEHQADPQEHADDHEHESVDSATEPRGVRSSGWPYEGGSHETGYPRNP